MKDVLGGGTSTNLVEPQVRIRTDRCGYHKRVRREMEKGSDHGGYEIHSESRTFTLIESGVLPASYIQFRPSKSCPFSSWRSNRTACQLTLKQSHRVNGSEGVGLNGSRGPATREVREAVELQLQR